MHKTPEQIRTLGLQVLKRELGLAGMIQFMQQFDQGSGNWAQERREWVDRTSLDDIRKATAERRRKATRRVTRKRRPR